MSTEEHIAQLTAQITTLHQGNSSVEERIQEFEIHGPISRLGDIGLVDRFEQVIHPQLQESIYCLEPMPTTWLEWKHKASLLENQWRWFQDMQPKAATNQCRWDNNILQESPTKHSFDGQNMLSLLS